MLAYFRQGVDEMGTPLQDRTDGLLQAHTLFLASQEDPLMATVPTVVRPSTVATHSDRSVLVPLPGIQLDVPGRPPSVHTVTVDDAQLSGPPYNAQQSGTTRTEINAAASTVLPQVAIRTTPNRVALQTTLDPSVPPLAQSINSRSVPCASTVLCDKLRTACPERKGLAADSYSTLCPGNLCGNRGGERSVD